MRFPHMAMTALCLFAPTTTQAHIALINPVPREAAQKSGPCGRAGSLRSNNISVFEPGETITVSWNETIGHPAHYRISLDENGDDDFAEPAHYEDYYTNDTVILDNIPDNAGTGPYSVEITLPNIECENCTLQLVQVMKDKPPYEIGTNDLYYQCADIVIRAPGSSADAGAGSQDTQPDAGVGSQDAGGPSQLEPDAGAGNQDANIGGDEEGRGQEVELDGGTGCRTGESGSIGLWTLLFPLGFLVRVLRNQVPKRRSLQRSGTFAVVTGVAVAVNPTPAREAKRFAGRSARR